MRRRPLAAGIPLDATLSGVALARARGNDPEEVDGVGWAKRSGIELTPVETKVLGAVGLSALANGEVADRAGMEYSKASNALHRLKAKGAVERVEDGWKLPDGAA